MGSPGPQPRVTSEKILEVFHQCDDPCAPLTASEVAEELDCARRTAYSKLQCLVDQGTVRTKKTGARGRIWWLPRSQWNAVGVSQPAVHETAVDSLVDDILDNVEVGVFVLDENSKVGWINVAAERYFGIDREHVIGQDKRKLIAGHIAPAVADPAGLAETVLSTYDDNTSAEKFECQVLTDDGREERWLEYRSKPIESGVYTGGQVELYYDVTDRRERERALHREQDMIERLLETSPMGVAVLNLDGEITRANARAEELLGLTRAEIEGRTYDEPDWNIYSEDGEAIPSDEHPVTNVLATGEPVLGFVHGITLSDGTERWLSSNSAPVFDGDGDIERVIVALEDITDLKTQEQEIKRQRNELAHLKRVDDVIRGIDRAIVNADTQAEIEQAVCEHIAASDPYLFAVIGGFSSTYDEFTPRAFAGLGEEYLDQMLHSDDTPPISEGLGAAAARTGEIQVAQHLTDLPYDFWQETAHEHGFQSYASIPLVYEDIVYGVLGVYAEQPNAFDEEERTILGELGEMIGHSINAIERIEALLADTVVELEFREKGELAGLFQGIEGATDVTGQSERTVLLDGGETLQYYTVSGIDVDQFSASLEQMPSIQQVRVLDQTGDIASLEVRTAGPTMASVFAKYGGRPTRTNFEDGEVRVVAEVPYGTDIRQVIDAVQDVYTDLEFVSRTTRERPTRSVAGLQDAMAEQLTDRQRTALEVGYSAGFFDWPRESTGEQLAETMNVAPSTFHKHLRYGERKLLRLLFDDEESSIA